MCEKLSPESPATEKVRQPTRKVPQARSPDSKADERFTNSQTSYGDPCLERGIRALAHERMHQQQAQAQGANERTSYTAEKLDARSRGTNVAKTEHRAQAIYLSPVC